jgi:rhodanese-related sulfurtransferase
MSKERFVELVTEGQPAAPGYFAYDAALNRQARPLMDERPLTSMDLQSVDAATATGAVVVDVRPVSEFAAGHLAGSLGIALDGRFAEQAGSIIDPATSIVLVGDADAVAEARVRLARIGFDLVLGGLTDVESTLAAHPNRARRLSRLTAASFIERQQAFGERLAVIDVRGPGEVDAAPVAGARNIPLARLRHEMADLDPTQPTVVLCAGGARSAIASSLLLAAGFEDVSDVLGGAAALAARATGHAASGS